MKSRIVYLLLFHINSIHGITSDFDNVKCKEKTCVPKCCPDGYLVQGPLRKSCIHHSDENLEFSDLKVYNEDLTQTSTVKDRLFLIPGMFKNESFKRQAIDLSMLENLGYYLTEAGVVYIEYPNSFNRWVKMNSNQFCIDYLLKVNGSKTPSPRLWVVFSETAKSDTDVTLSYYAKLMSCIFLLVLLIGKSLEPSNRTLSGVVQLLFVFSFFKAFVLLYVMSIRSWWEDQCRDMTYSIYFFYLSGFSWIGVMAYDTWTTIRCHVNDNPIRCHNGFVKMLLYCLGGWGPAFFLTTVFILMNSVDLHHMPWVITPQVPNNGCFINGGERALYLLVPALVMLVVPAAFTFFTARHMIRLKLETVAKHAVIPAELHSHLQRFKVNVALLAVVFVHCVIELAGLLSSATGLISDIYGILFCPLIFFVLVIYPMILRKAAQRRQNLQPMCQSTAMKTIKNGDIPMRSNI